LAGLTGLVKLFLLWRISYPTRSWHSGWDPQFGKHPAVQNDPNRQCACNQNQIPGHL